jgi:DNA primase
VYEEAARYFQVCFGDEKDPFGEQVRRYWMDKRRFSLETARNFGIGCSPLQPDRLWTHLVKYGMNPEILRPSGLFYGTTGNRSLHSRFQGRLMIPIRDIQGRVVAFSGRQLPFATSPSDPAREAKYINSPETPLFSKGQILFNLDKARSHVGEIPYLFFVEGPLDAVRCYEAGLRTVVASQGTAITETQLMLVRRYGNPLVCFLDGDLAGQKSGIRWLELALKIGLSMQFLMLEEEKDPDAFFLRHPETSWQELEKQRVHPVTFLVRVLNSLEKNPDKARAQTLEKLFPALGQSDSALVIHDFLRQLSFEWGVPLRRLEVDFERFLKKKSSKGPSSIESLPEDRPDRWLHTLEAQLLMELMASRENLLRWVPRINGEELNPQNPCSDLIRKVMREVKEKGLGHLSDFPTWELSEKEQKVWFFFSNELTMLTPKEDGSSPLTSCLARIHRRFLKKQILDLDKKMADTSSRLQTVDFQKCQTERLRLKRALADENQMVPEDI